MPLAYPISIPRLAFQEPGRFSLVLAPVAATSSSIRIPYSTVSAALVGDTPDQFSIGTTPYFCSAREKLAGQRDSRGPAQPPHELCYAAPKIPAAP